MITDDAERGDLVDRVRRGARRRQRIALDREDGTPTREHGGLGLGLAIVRELTELHGGSVQAFSAGPGLGSRFVIRLPLAE